VNKVPTFGKPFYRIMELLRAGAGGLADGDQQTSAAPLQLQFLRNGPHRSAPAFYGQLYTLRVGLTPSPNSASLALPADQRYFGWGGLRLKQTRCVWESVVASSSAEESGTCTVGGGTGSSLKEESTTKKELCVSVTPSNKLYVDGYTMGVEGIRRAKASTAHQCEERYPQRRGVLRGDRLVCINGLDVSDMPGWQLRSTLASLAEEAQEVQRQSHKAHHGQESTGSHDKHARSSSAGRKKGVVGCLALTMRSEGWGCQMVSPSPATLSLLRTIQGLSRQPLPSAVGVTVDRGVRATAEDLELLLQCFYKVYNPLRIFKAGAVIRRTQHSKDGIVGSIRNRLGDVDVSMMNQLLRDKYGKDLTDMSLHADCIAMDIRADRESSGDGGSVSKSAGAGKTASSAIDMGEGGGEDNSESSSSMVPSEKSAEQSAERSSKQSSEQLPPSLVSLSDILDDSHQASFFLNFLTPDDPDDMPGMVCTPDQAGLLFLLGVRHFTTLQRALCQEAVQIESAVVARKARKTAVEVRTEIRAEAKAKAVATGGGSVVVEIVDAVKAVEEEDGEDDQEEENEVDEEREEERLRWLQTDWWKQHSILLKHGHRIIRKFLSASSPYNILGSNCPGRGEVNSNSDGTRSDEAKGQSENQIAEDAGEVAKCILLLFDQNSVTQPPPSTICTPRKNKTPIRKAKPRARVSASLPKPPRHVGGKFETRALLRIRAEIEEDAPHCHTPLKHKPVDGAGGDDEGALAKEAEQSFELEFVSEVTAFRVPDAAEVFGSVQQATMVGLASSFAEFEHSMEYEKMVHVIREELLGSKLTSILQPLTAPSLSVQNQQVQSNKTQEATQEAPRSRVLYPKRARGGLAPYRSLLNAFWVHLYQQRAGLRQQEREHCTGGSTIGEHAVYSPSASMAPRSKITRMGTQREKRVAGRDGEKEVRQQQHQDYSVPMHELSAWMCVNDQIAPLFAQLEASGARLDIATARCTNTAVCFQRELKLVLAHQQQQTTVGTGTTGNHEEFSHHYSCLASLAADAKRAAAVLRWEGMAVRTARKRFWLAAHEMCTVYLVGSAQLPPFPHISSHNTDSHPQQGQVQCTAEELQEYSDENCDDKFSGLPVPPSAASVPSSSSSSFLAPHHRRRLQQQRRKHKIDDTLGRSDGDNALQGVPLPFAQSLSPLEHHHYGRQSPYWSRLPSLQREGIVDLVACVCLGGFHEQGPEWEGSGGESGATTVGGAADAGTRTVVKLCKERELVSLLVTAQDWWSSSCKTSFASFLLSDSFRTSVLGESSQSGSNQNDGKRRRRRFGGAFVAPKAAATAGSGVKQSKKTKTSQNLSDVTKTPTAKKPEERIVEPTSTASLSEAAAGVETTPSTTIAWVEALQQDTEPASTTKETISAPSATPTKAANANKTTTPPPSTPSSGYKPARSAVEQANSTPQHHIQSPLPPLTPSALSRTGSKSTLEERVVAFYQVHNPAKLSSERVDRVLSAYAGKGGEARLNADLRRQYGGDLRSVSKHEGAGGDEGNEAEDENSENNSVGSNRSVEKARRSKKRASKTQRGLPFSTPTSTAPSKADPMDCFESNHWWFGEGSLSPVVSRQVLDEELVQAASSFSVFADTLPRELLPSFAQGADPNTTLLKKSMNDLADAKKNAVVGAAIALTTAGAYRSARQKHAGARGQILRKEETEPGMGMDVPPAHTVSTAVTTFIATDGLLVHFSHTPKAKEGGKSKEMAMAKEGREGISKGNVEVTEAVKEEEDEGRGPMEAITSPSTPLVRLRQEKGEKKEGKEKQHVQYELLASKKPNTRKNLKLGCVSHVVSFEIGPDGTQLKCSCYPQPLEGDDGPQDTQSVAPSTTFDSDEDESNEKGDNEEFTSSKHGLAHHELPPHLTQLPKFLLPMGSHVKLAAVRELEEDASKVAKETNRNDTGDHVPATAAAAGLGLAAANKFVFVGGEFGLCLAASTLLPGNLVCLAVANIAPGSQAERLGLRCGDVVVGVNGDPLAGLLKGTKGRARDFARAVAKLPHPVTLHVNQQVKECFVKPRTTASVEVQEATADVAGRHKRGGRYRRPTALDFPQPLAFDFVMGDMHHGNETHATCLVLWQWAGNVDENAQWDGAQDKQGEQCKPQWLHVFCPTGVCLLSSAPLHTEMRRRLQQLYSSQYQLQLQRTQDTEMKQQSGHSHRLPQWWSPQQIRLHQSRLQQVASAVVVERIVFCARDLHAVYQPLTTTSRPQTNAPKLIPSSLTLEGLSDTARMYVSGQQAEWTGLGFDDGVVGEASDHWTAFWLKLHVAARSVDELSLDAVMDATGMPLHTAEQLLEHPEADGKRSMGAEDLDTPPALAKLDTASYTSCNVDRPLDVPHSASAGGCDPLALSVLFECIDVPNLLNILAALLAEQSVLLLSSRYSALVHVAEALRSLLACSPRDASSGNGSAEGSRWCGVYAPLLPRPMLPMIQCPTPFLFGVHTDYAPASLLHPLQSSNAKGDDSAALPNDTSSGGKRGSREKSSSGSSVQQGGSFYCDPSSPLSSVPFPLPAALAEVVSSRGGDHMPIGSTASAVAASGGDHEGLMCELPARCLLVRIDDNVVEVVGTELEHISRGQGRGQSGAGQAESSILQLPSAQRHHLESGLRSLLRPNFTACDSLHHGAPSGAPAFPEAEIRKLFRQAIDSLLAPPLMHVFRLQLPLDPKPDQETEEQRQRRVRRQQGFVLGGKHMNEEASEGSLLGKNERAPKEKDRAAVTEVSSESAKRIAVLDEAGFLDSLPEGSHEHAFYQLLCRTQMFSQHISPPA
jgi:hypothetical protein